jgi:predicted ABC-type ATPase
MEWFWIVAGHNGAGKSTLTRRLGTIPSLARTVVLDPDMIARDPLGELADRVEANLGSVRVCQSIVEMFLAKGAGIGLETVLSTDKYRPLVRLAKKSGMRFGLIYVCLSTAELAIKRVEGRVALGLHDVSPEKIVERREKSFGQLRWFLKEADFAVVYCNDDSYQEILSKVGDKVRSQGVEAVPQVAKIAAEVQRELLLERLFSNGSELGGIGSCSI